VALFIKDIWLIWTQVARFERKIDFDLLLAKSRHWIIQGRRVDRMYEDGGLKSGEKDKGRKNVTRKLGG